MRAFGYWPRVLLSIVGILAAGVTATACPFCSAPTLTLAEQAAQSDVVLLAAWQSGSKSQPDDPESRAETTFEIRHASKGDFAKNDSITLAGYQPAEQGELFLLTAIKTDQIQWDIPTAFSEKAFEYMAGAPVPQSDDGERIPARKRLPYFIKFLENPDETIANDAYAEFANAPYDEIVAITGQLDRQKVRRWVLDPETPPARLGLYGLLLGLSGNDADARAMKTLITAPNSDFRIGLDGVISGYLLLTGKTGLDHVREIKLENDYLVDASGQPITDDAGEKIPVPFSETYATMQAVRFMWDYGSGRIDAEELKQTMRLLLDHHPELADMAITDLARWEDWSVMERLFKLYDAKAYQIPAIKRSIIRYFDAAKNDLPEDAEQQDQVPEHVEKAREYYAAIKKKDPKTVKSVEQFLMLIR